MPLHGAVAGFRLMASIVCTGSDRGHSCLALRRDGEHDERFSSADDCDSGQPTEDPEHGEHRHCMSGTNVPFGE
jgi:hypothetical protein